MASNGAAVAEPQASDSKFASQDANSSDQMVQLHTELIDSAVAESAHSARIVWAQVKGFPFWPVRRYICSSLFCAPFARRNVCSGPYSRCLGCVSALCAASSPWTGPLVLALHIACSASASYSCLRRQHTIHYSSSCTNLEISHGHEATCCTCIPHPVPHPLPRSEEVTKVYSVLAAQQMLNSVVNGSCCFDCILSLAG